MYFGLSEEQQSIQESIGKFLEDEATVENIKLFNKGNLPDLPDTIHEGLLELGVHGLIIPEEYGGLGLDLLFATAVSQALGTGIAVSPYIGSYVLAPFAITNLGSDQQKEKYLRGITDLKIRFGVGLTEFIAAREKAQITLKNNEINGRALFVIDASQATHFLISDSLGILSIINANDPGLEIINLTTVDKTSSVVELRMNKVKAELLDSPNNDSANTQKLVDLGRLLIAADSLGAAQVMINKAVEYANERKQFGRLIGSFQAVKHMCAQMTADIEPCYALIWYSAHCMEHLPEESNIMASHSKAHVSEVASVIAKTSTEVHGGMGFTDELGLHYWFKRIGLNRQLLGGVNTVREEAADAQGF